MIKIALIGTSCSGKTTTAYELVARLRKSGYHAEGNTSSDRIYPFAQEKLNVLHEAQCYVILQHAFLETRAAVRDDVDIIISDRSVLDFFAYYDYCFKDRQNTAYFKSLKLFVFEWIKTYDLIFYLPPLPWVNDNKRPSDEFRMGVDNVIKSYISELDTIIKIENSIESAEFIDNYIRKYINGKD